MGSEDYDTASPVGSSSDYELMIMELPANCTSTSTLLNSTLSSVEYLYQSGTILWPNFTHCHPNCGLCTTFASDHTYIMVNLVIIGVMLPIIGFCGRFRTETLFIFDAQGYSATGCLLLYTVVHVSTIQNVFSKPILAMRKSSTNLYLCVLGISDNAVIVGDFI